MRGALLALVVALPWLAAGAAALEPPPFCIIRYTPSADFRTLRVVQDLELNASDFAALASQVDADGDGDLTPGEVAAYETASRQDLPFENLGAKKLAIDGRSSSAVVRRDLTAFEGPAATVAQRGKVQEVRDHTFESDLEAQETHRLEGGAGAYRYRKVVETVVFEAPPGWQVWSVNGSESFRGNTSVQITGFDTETRFSVSFAKLGYDPNRRDLFEIPGPAPLLLLAAALLWAFALRRR